MNRGTGGDELTSVRLLEGVEVAAATLVKAVHVRTCVKAAYELVAVVTQGPTRGRWGRALKLLGTAGGWDDRAVLVETADVLDGLVAGVVGLLRGRHRPGSTGADPAIVTLAYLAVAGCALRRRLMELPDTAPTTSAAGGDAA